MNTASSPITKPMLADKCERLHALSFPLLATPKLDGIRCLKINGRALTRSFKPVSNRFIREWIEANLPDGLDGELIVKGTTFNETAGHVGRESGEPDFTFAVFDYVSDGIDVPYACRMQELARLPDYERVDKVLPEEMHSLDDLMAYEERCVSEGYEGMMIRTPGSPYKCGRSTEREGYLLKIKRFEDAEAVVLDTYEGMSNHNAAEKDAFGAANSADSSLNTWRRASSSGWVTTMSSGVWTALPCGSSGSRWRVGCSSSSTSPVERRKRLGSRSSSDSVSSGTSHKWPLKW
jgi:DNA ligase-1